MRCAPASEGLGRGGMGRGVLPDRPASLVPRKPRRGNTWDLLGSQKRAPPNSTDRCQGWDRIAERPSVPLRPPSAPPRTAHCAPPSAPLPAPLAPPIAPPIRPPLHVPSAPHSRPIRPPPAVPQRYKDREEQYYRILKGQQSVWQGLPDVHIWDYSRWGGARGALRRAGRF
jgi:hypothetical protein